MQRIALALRYDGSAYHGWQIQTGLRTVQGQVEKALSFVAHHSVTIYCAGRTDAGVHACAQVVHFDTTSERSLEAWVFGTNSNLPGDISIIWAQNVSDTFHARYSAYARCYRYIIYNNKIRPGILRKQVGWYYRPLNEKDMQKAALYLLGEHDFSSFQGSDCQSKTPIREIFAIKIFRVGELVVLDVRANAFLLHMVRNIVGVLVVIGSGEKEPEWAKEVLLAKNRAAAAVTFEPNGLYLIGVDYPAAFDLPNTEMKPFFLSMH